MPIIDTLLSTPIGCIKITVNNKYLTNLKFIQKSTLKIDNSIFVKSIEQQLQSYFSNPKFKIKIPIKPHGTTFQKSVWNKLQEIPSGIVCTYGELAKKLNSSPRAIGQACKANPIPIIIPCHRIISKTSVGGFMGNSTKFLKIKKNLLSHEQVNLKF